MSHQQQREPTGEQVLHEHETAQKPANLHHIGNEHGLWGFVTCCENMLNEPSKGRHPHERSAEGEKGQDREEDPERNCQESELVACVSKRSRRHGTLNR